MRSWKRFHALRSGSDNKRLRRSALKCSKMNGCRHIHIYMTPHQRTRRPGQLWYVMASTRNMVKCIVYSFLPLHCIAPQTTTAAPAAGPHVSRVTHAVSSMNAPMKFPRHSTWAPAYSRLLNGWTKSAAARWPTGGTHPGAMVPVHPADR